MVDHLGPVQNDRDEQEPCVEPKLLGPDSQISRRAFRSFEVPPAEYGLVEDVGLDEEPDVAGPHVLAEVQLADSARDLADFPALEAALNQLQPVLLLELPEPRVSLEHLVEEVALARATVCRHVANPSELPVRALHQRPERLQRELVVLGHAGIGEERECVCALFFSSPSGDDFRRRSSENLERGGGEKGRVSNRRMKTKCVCGQRRREGR